MADFNSPEGNVEDFFVNKQWIVDQFIGKQLWGWGPGDTGIFGQNNTFYINTPTNLFPSSTSWTSIRRLVHNSPNVASVIATKSDGTLWTWGSARNGVLGINDAVYSSGDRLTPVTTFVGGTDWNGSQLAVTSRTCSALKIDGTIWSWGWDVFGVSGSPREASSRYTPVTTFAGGTTWKDDTTSPKFGPAYTGAGAAIKDDGTLWTWGYNGFGGLGNNTSDYAVTTPVTTFAGGTNWKYISTDQFIYSKSAIKTDGTLWVWGSNFNSILGVGDTTHRCTPVTTFAGGTNWAQVSVGYQIGAIKTDGTLWMWGSNGSGQCGVNDASYATSKSTPVTTFAGGTNWRSVSCNTRNSMAVKTDGTLWVWGRNTEGQLGVGDTINRSTPVTTFAGGTNWLYASAGFQHCGGIKTDGTIWVWGNNSGDDYTGQTGASGQLGVGDTINRSTPVTTFAGGTNWKELVCGYRNTYAIKTDGTLWTWGRNYDGSLGINASGPRSSVRSTPVTTFAGGTNWHMISYGFPSYEEHVFATKTDGTLWAWGANSFYSFLGDLRDPSSNGLVPTNINPEDTAWGQFSVGEYVASGIKTDGTLWVWGVEKMIGVNYVDTQSTGLSSDSTFKHETPVTTFAGGNNWKQVSCGESFISAIKTDGTLWFWGKRPSVTPAGVGYDATPVTTFAGGNDWKQVSCGQYMLGAIKTDGTLWTWGETVNSSYPLFGTNDSETSKCTPVTTFAGGNDWKTITCGGKYVSAFKTDGTLWVWGRVPQPGGGVTQRSVPTTFAIGGDWVDIANDKNYAWNEGHLALKPVTEETFDIS